MSNEKRSITGHICCPKCENQFFRINLELEFDLPMEKSPENISSARYENGSTQKEPKHQQEYLREKDVVKMTSINIATLRSHRSQRKGLPYIKMGRSVVYRRKDIINLLKHFLAGYALHLYLLLNINLRHMKADSL